MAAVKSAALITFGLGVSAAALAAPVIVTAPTGVPVVAAPVASPKSTIQQQFDDGTAAMSAGEWRRAFDIYTALEVKLSARTPPPKSLAVVRLRKSLAMYRIGQREAAEPMMVAALAQLAVDDASLFSDRAIVLKILGDAAERRYDYPGAIARFRAAHDVTPDIIVKLAAATRLIQIGIFVDPNAALADADAAIALVDGHPEVNKEWAGTMRGLRGRVLLNLGRLKEARADLGLAIKQLGGLDTNKINLLDASARSDAAIAALRDNAPDEARKYLAYSGSTQQADQGFRLGTDMNPPACGGINGPKPDDVAVIEFNINDDGSVGVATPVFFSGERGAAAEFARAVSEWSWNPDQLAKVVPFFRALTRLELRCTTVFSRPNAVSLLIPAVNKWLSEKSAGMDDVKSNSAPARLPNLNIELFNRATKFGADSVQMIEPLTRLSYSGLLTFELASSYAKRAYDIAVRSKAPAPVLAFLGLNAWRFYGTEYRGDGRDKYHIALQAALADPVIAADPTASAAIRVAFFDTLNLSNRLTNGEAILAPVIADVKLSANDPYKVGALTRLTSVEFGKGKIDDARALFAKTGLSAQQCALVDAQPVQRSGTIRDRDYPSDALRFGFGGWTVVEFDIDANGGTVNQRPLIAWPPFVFGKPAVKGVSSFRYQQSYRPEGGLGCGGQQQRISYTIQPRKDVK